MLLVAYGTRPEHVKLKPLLPLLRERVPLRVLFTGQHEMLAGDGYDVALEIRQAADHGDRLDAVVRAALDAPDAVFDGIRAALDAPDAVFDGIRAVLVQGDTASAFGVALAAFHRGIAVYHLEAGLRTGDLTQPFPEELYRQQISRMAALHLCPTPGNRANLEAERCPGRKEVVGNTVLDNLVGLDVRYDGPVIMSLHRRENQARTADWLRAFDALAAAHPAQRFVFIRHPNPEAGHLRDAMRCVEFVEPRAYDDMIRELAACRLVITDSGGFQEEASFLGKRLIVCRRATERPECLGTHSELCPAPEHLAALFSRANADPVVTAPCPFGDGRSAPRVVGLLDEMLRR